MRGAGFVRSTEETRGSTKARPKRSTEERPKRSTEERPKRSTDARRRFRAEQHQGTRALTRPRNQWRRTTKNENRGGAEGFVRSTEARSTKARLKSREPPRPRKGPSRSTAEAEEGIEQEHRRGRGTRPRTTNTEEGDNRGQGMRARRRPRSGMMEAMKRVTKERNMGLVKDRTN
jgi:hypothetical protein